MKLNPKNNYHNGLTNYIGIDDKWYDNGAVMRYDLDEGFYTRFSDGRWMISKKGVVKGTNKLYYVPIDYKENLTIDNLEKLDKIASRNIESKGRLVSVVLENGREKINFVGTVRHIEKILPRGIDRDNGLKELIFQISG